jgi:hypothetical protein
MKRFVPILFAGLFFLLTATLSTTAQENNQEIIFIFPSADKLINSLESDVDKTITFEVSGLNSSLQSDKLIQDFLGFSKEVTGLSISEKKQNELRDGSLFLYRTIKTSYFTKLLFTCGVRNIIVENNRIATVELNDKSRFFVK